MTPQSAHEQAQLRAGQAALAERYVDVELPEWLWGGKPQGFVDAARWHAERLPGGTHWRIRLAERATRKPGRLVQVHRLANARNVDSTGAYARLATLPPHARHLSVSPAQVEAELDRMTGTNHLGPTLNALTLATLSAHEDQLPDVVQHNLRVLLGIEALEGAAAVHLINVDPAINFRASAVRLLLLLKDPDGARALTAALSRGDASQPLPLASARGLNSDLLLGLEAYLGPLLLSAAPWVWGVAAGRAGGVMIYTLGSAVLGRQSHVTEALQLFHPRGSQTHDRARPMLTGAQLEATLGWYVGQLDSLFTEITDPANYRDTQSGHFLPRAQCCAAQPGAGFPQCAIAQRPGPRPARPSGADDGHPGHPGGPSAAQVRHHD